MLLRREFLDVLKRGQLWCVRSPSGVHTVRGVYAHHVVNELEGTSPNIRMIKV
jgi:hypothetical protein